jgi:beta-galactosidase
VDFELNGPAIWRGGYNSGNTNSINATHLDLECGINRVAIRSTREHGTVTLRASSRNLKPASITLMSDSFEAVGVLSSTLPAMPVIALPRTGSDTAAGDTMPPLSSVKPRMEKQAGQFASAFSYSGPTGSANIERDAREGKKVYLDRDYTFISLPQLLLGGDYVCAANADKTYNAVDLMEVAVKNGMIISVAHDDRLPRPTWLTRQFTSTDLSLTINKQRMTIFQHKATADESLTLGANTETTSLKSCNMYVVFVNGPSMAQADRAMSRTP